jgi:hypothetical protein
MMLKFVALHDACARSLFVEIRMLRAALSDFTPVKSSIVASASVM